MILDKAMRRKIRLQSTLFIVLFLSMMGMLAWLSQLYSVSIDLSKNERNSLSPESIRLSKTLEQPMHVTIFVTPGNESGDMINRLFQRYQYQQPLIQVETLNPDLYPELLRQHDIREDAETLIEYRGRSEKISRITEAKVTNTIQRLMRQGERWAVFLQGHGERDPYSETNHDLSDFASRLASKGYTIESLNLAQASSIPQNTDVLIIASPQVALLPGEVDLIKAYVEQGGNLLWLADPASVISPLDRLADALAIEFLPGVIVDPNSQLLGLDRVDFALVADYPRHPITQNVESLSLYPQAQAVEYHGAEDKWQQLNFLVSGDSSWNETGAMQGEIFNGDDADELNGPLNIGITLSTAVDTESGSRQQRIAVVGDADFLSNSYLGNGANLELGLNLFNWLSHDDSLISISPRAAPDTRLELSQNQQVIIGMLFLLVLPLALIGSGLGIWFKRRRR
ncbi:MAG: ABC-type uncharacterized transport system involved in gliding motility auxiliary subunit [Gammaproteobacteria bacterium]|jgi:ABC-type uncharacterized transport system involved in gliding motility auxiliary subunit